MKTVTISKERLLRQLIKNRQKHSEEFVEAHTKWGEEVIKTLQAALYNATKDAVFRTNFNIPEPSNHLQEYDTVIEQINWTEDEIITLDQADFRRFIQDNWEWKQNFDMTNSFYIKK